MVFGRLPGTDHNGVDGQRALLALHGDVKPVVVDVRVGHAALHEHSSLLEVGPVNPARGLAEPRAVLPLLALRVKSARRYR